jgi:hypothetical protein
MCSGLPKLLLFVEYLIQPDLKIAAGEIGVDNIALAIIQDI